MDSALLVVDDDPLVLNSLRRAFHAEGYTVWSAGSGKSGLELLDRHDIGVVISDRMMPEMDGIGFLEAVKANHPEVVRILLTAHADLDNAMEAVNRTHIFAYLTKPWSEEMLKGTIARGFDHFRLVQENKRLLKLTEEQNLLLNENNQVLEGKVRRRTVELEDAVQEGISMLAKAAEAKDDDTGQHVYRIQAMTETISSALGLAQNEVNRMGLASIAHDIGKIHIPDHILKKSGPLSADEWAVMKTHTIAGEAILGTKPFYRLVREVARSHHERWDGGGYPDGLKGCKIPLSARIVTVADVFDALTHCRPYKPAWPIETSLEQMRQLSGTVFDPDILKVFLAVVNEAEASIGE